MKIVRTAVYFLLRPIIRLKEILPKNARLNSAVRLHDYVEIGGIFFDKPKELLESLGEDRKNPLLEPGEFYPLYYDSNPKTLDLLELVIEKNRPAIVVETGVANGASTRRILEAFKRFGLVNSKLYSFDIDSRVAAQELIENPQFTFILVDSPERFTSSLREIGSVDLFYHDSDHSYKNQMLEYSEAWKVLSKEKGVLISDDVDWSNAFLDFCKEIGRIPLLLSDISTFSGIICK
jgi:predicted O-methyltransferase YrrM